MQHCWTERAAPNDNISWISHGFKHAGWEHQCMVDNKKTERDRLVCVEQTKGRNLQMDNFGCANKKRFTNTSQSVPLLFPSSSHVCARRGSSDPLVR